MTNLTKKTKKTLKNLIRTGIEVATLPNSWKFELNIDYDELSGIFKYEAVIDNDEIYFYYYPSDGLGIKDDGFLRINKLNKDWLVYHFNRRKLNEVHVNGTTHPEEFFLEEAQPGLESYLSKIQEKFENHLSKVKEKNKLLMLENLTKL